MRSKWIFLAITAILTFSNSCVQAPEYPDEPVITYAGMNKTTVHQGSPTAPLDTLEIRFNFTDGDGDLRDIESGIPDISVMDSRDNSVTPFFIPEFTRQGAGNGISGEITIKILNKPGAGICCVFPNSTACVKSTTFPTNTMFYTIKMRDQAGHESNTIQTEQITILCD
ncbi:MAG TPA: hypothetical protein PKE06_02945 [Flavilitoribacter sp.]|nr:hypothetical protein [Flavilitoribacter sp.]HMQ87915.1 hypothetical protein [Flavilitoribacter sp.]